ncbi:S-layer protein [Methanocaldococcus fervens]|uniref:S-layer protein n=1 Tax=Methanocaldococcus fervens (strain DSM 4213 / JCM 15782 / AG86) TaxID=573064 RepID=C7P6P8_METFA|nr:S-layer protein [Methanocaldococcus fervens]ACV24230.1 S-layer protein [Methanocaldococcus fervens AG86]
MAMSLKKIGAIAVGGAMVATALASGVAAEVTVQGEVTKDLFVKNGQPNCYVVVGADAPSTMDVVSAADIAAKIGSLCYKEGTVEDGSAEITVHAEAKSDDVDVYAETIPEGNYTVFVAASDSDYADAFENDTGDPYGLADALGVDDDELNEIVSLGDVSTMLKIEDVDPKDWYDSDDDAGEIVAVAVQNDSGELMVDKKNAVYMSLVYTNDEEKFENTTQLKLGMRIPFLGKEQVVVRIKTDDDSIGLGTLVYDGVLKEGETYDVGNGYAVKVKSILKSSTPGEYKVTVDILKDGKVIIEKTDVVTNRNALKIGCMGKISVVVHSAWMDVGENYGYAELIIAKDVKCLYLGEDYINDWVPYAVLKNGNNIELKKDISDSDRPKIVGIAFRYEGDEFEDLDDGDEVDILDYITFKLDDKDKEDKLYVYFSMDKTVDATVNVGEKVTALNAEVKLKGIEANAVEPVALTAPIAKLDTEVSLDSADKNLILVGGPVANKLTKALVDAGKLALDNDSPATIAVLPGEANGHDVVVVAGGDREKTREAALELIKML